MGNEEHRPSLFAYALHLVKTLPLKPHVAHRQYFIDDQNFRFEVCRHRKSETHVHAAAITLHRGVDKSFQLGKSNNLIEVPRDLFPFHPEDRSIQEYVLTTGKFRMKAGPYSEQAGDPTIQFDATGSRFRNARKNFE